MSLSGVAKSARGRTVVLTGETEGSKGAGVFPWAVGASQLVSLHDGEEHICLTGKCALVHPSPGTFILIVAAGAERVSWSWFGVSDVSDNADVVAVTFAPYFGKCTCFGSTVEWSV